MDSRGGSSMDIGKQSPSIETNEKVKAQHRKTMSYWIKVDEMEGVWTLTDKKKISWDLS